MVASSHHVRKRVSEREARERNNERHLEGVEHHVCIERNCKQAAIVAEREYGVGDTEQEYVADRNDEEGEQVEGGGSHQQPDCHRLAGATRGECRLRGGTHKTA